MVSDTEIEAACKAFLAEYGDPSAEWWDYRKEVIAALSAAARVRAEDNAGEPVEALPEDDEPKTWQELAEAAIADLRRYANDETPERRLVSVEAYEERAARLSALTAGKPEQEQSVHIEQSGGDVFADLDVERPVPQPSGPVEALELEPLLERLEGPVFGTETARRAAATIRQLWDMLKGCRVANKDATVRAAKAEAKVADLNEMVLRYLYRAETAEFRLSALTAGKPEQECATEGCDKPATDYFERGGVGSHYCPGCYLKVQAVTTPTHGRR